MHESEKWKWSHSVVSDSSNPRDCSLPVSSVHGIFQAGVLEWGAIAFSDILHCVYVNSSLLVYPSTVYPLVTVFVFCICYSAAAKALQSYLWLYCFVNKFICTLFFRFHIKVISYDICLLCLTYFTQYNSRSLNIALNGIILFFLWLSSIPLYMYSVYVPHLLLSISLLMDI